MKGHVIHAFFVDLAQGTGRSHLNYLTILKNRKSVKSYDITENAFFIFLLQSKSIKHLSMTKTYMSTVLINVEQPSYLNS